MNRGKSTQPKPRKDGKTWNALAGADLTRPTIGMWAGWRE